MNDGHDPEGLSPTPRPTSVRIAAAAVVALLALGFPILLLIYGTAGDSTRSVVGSVMAVMVGATVVAWFFTRSRAKTSGEDKP